jgi:hydroxymethylpyrimidine pyrophosphatase-like HAD family hydrolase
MRSIDEFRYDRPVKLWGIDYDGVMTNGSVPSRASKKGLELIASSGAKPMIATARPPRFIHGIVQPNLSEAVGSMVVAGFNGALIYVGDEVVNDVPLPQRFTDRLLGCLRQNRHPANINTKDKNYGIEPDSDWNRAFTEEAGFSQSQDRLRRGTPCYMVEIYVPNDGRASDVIEQVREIQDMHGKSLQCYEFKPPFEELGSMGNTLQFSSGKGKLPAISLVAERLGISMNSVVCIGDGLNDEDMISHPETVGVVMGQADELASRLDGNGKRQLYQTKTYLADGFLYAVEKIHGGRK